MLPPVLRLKAPVTMVMLSSACRSMLFKLVLTEMSALAVLCVMLSLACREMFPVVLLRLALRVMLASLPVPSALSPALSKMLPVAAMPSAAVLVPPPTVMAPAVVMSTRCASLPAVRRSSWADAGLVAFKAPVFKTRSTVRLKGVTVTASVSVRKVLPLPDQVLRF